MSDFFFQNTWSDNEKNMKVFLSHSWGVDELRRDTHKRVVDVKHALKCINIDSWLDEDHMVNDIDNAMAKGIDVCDAVLVFVTRKYVTKVETAASNPLLRNNCYKEFSYAQSTCKLIIPVVFEPCMRCVSSWPLGIVRMHLGSKLYVDGATASAVETASDINKTLRRNSLLGFTFQIPPIPVPVRRAPQLDPAFEQRFSKKVMIDREIQVTERDFQTNRRRLPLFFWCTNDVPKY